MRTIILLTYLLLSLSVFSQSEIILSDGVLKINNHVITDPSNKQAIDQAIGTSGRHQLIIKTHKEGVKLENDTKHHVLTYKEKAIKVELSAPGYKFEEVLVRMSIEPLHDLPRRLQKKPFVLYQGIVQIGEAKLNNQLRFEQIDSVFNPADIIMKGNKVFNKKTVPYALIKHQDWLIELMFSYESSLIKYVSIKH